MKTSELEQTELVIVLKAIAEAGGELKLLNDDDLHWGAYELWDAGLWDVDSADRCGTPEPNQAFVVYLTDAGRELLALLDSAEGVE